MDTLTLHPATTLSSVRLARLLNQAYADYYVSVRLDPYQFEQMCDEMDVDLSRSVVAMVGERGVGLALLSVRQREGWVSGVGVRPAWRRRGIARRMMQRLQQQARADGLARLRLEVLTQNEAATHLYETLGFTWHRELLVMMLARNELPSAHRLATPESPRMSTSTTEASIGPEEPTSLLHVHRCFHEHDPSWQRDLPSLRKRASRMQGLALREDRKLVGYVLFHPHHDMVTVLDLAVHPAHPRRMQAARRLLMSVHTPRPSADGYVINVPAEDPLSAAFIDIGYRVWQRQAEMVWPVRDVI